MTLVSSRKKTQRPLLPPVKNAQWEIPPDDHFGYTDDDEYYAQVSFELLLGLAIVLSAIVFAPLLIMYILKFKNR